MVHCTLTSTNTALHILNITHNTLLAHLAGKTMPPVYSNRCRCRTCMFICGIALQVMQDKKYSLTSEPHQHVLTYFTSVLTPNHFEGGHLHDASCVRGSSAKYFRGPLSHLSVVLNTGKNTLVKKPPQSTSLVFLAVDLSDTHRM